MEVRTRHPSTCHTAPFTRCRVVIPMANRRSSCTVSRTIRRPRSPSLPSSAAVDVTSSHPWHGRAITRMPIASACQALLVGCYLLRASLTKPCDLND